MASPNLKTDSPTSRRIVRAFLEFLNSVEPAPGADLEGLEVARECLEAVFKLDSERDQTKPDSLVEIFSSLGTEELQENKSGLHHKSVSVDAPSSSISQACSDSNRAKETKSLAEDSSTKARAFGPSKDELFGQFFAALEKIRYFRMMPDGSDDPVGVEKATRLFHDALTEMEKSGCQEYNTKNLAETLKSQGNKAMQSLLFIDAIELYNCAIALCENNAVYYCNRAAAYTRAHKYNEAIKDCLKSIEIDPNYSKGYSRLGTAYFNQGNYVDAINKGFMIALRLDPNNQVVLDNIRMAEQELRRAERDRSASSSSGTEAGSTPSGPMPFNMSGMPPDFANMFMNMASNAFQGQNRQQGHYGTEDVQVDGNINLNFSSEMPEEVTGTIRTVMEMFTGAPPHQGSDHTDAARPS